MNKETENEKLASNIVKLNDIDKRLGKLEQLYSKPKVFLDTWVRPVVGLEIAAATQIEKQGDHIDNFLRDERNYEYFKEGIRFTVLFASISVFVTSLFSWISFLIIALGEMSPLGSWIGFAVSLVFFLLAICLGLKYLPKSIKIWWGRSRIGRKINRFVRFGKRIWRIGKRA